MYNNLLLSNWINSVKMNNSNLNESLKGGLGQKNEEISNYEQNGNELMKEQQRLNPQIQDQQSILFLLQQINLYR